MVQFNRKDASLSVTKALPNGAATVNSDGIAIGAGLLGVDHEFELLAPVLTTARLGDAQTMTYSIQTASDAAFTSPTTIYPSLIVQTGAGAAGAAAASRRFSLSSDQTGYVRAVAVKSGSGDASGASLELNLHL